MVFNDDDDDGDDDDDDDGYVGSGFTHHKQNAKENNTYDAKK